MPNPSDSVLNWAAKAIADTFWMSYALGPATFENGKFYRQWRIQNHTVSVLYIAFIRKSLGFPFCCQLFLFFDCICRKYADSNSAKQGHFSSSAFKTSISLPRHDRSLGWPHCTTKHWFIFHVLGNRTPPNWSLFLRRSHRHLQFYHFDRRFSTNNDCNNCGQTPCSFTWCKI